MYNELMEEYRSAINNNLDKMLQMQADDGKVAEAMRYSLLDGGKRIRGVLVLASCSLITGGGYFRAVPAACAVEMLHCYSLIHDDLPCMDDDDMRRGKPSCHKQFGEAIALLAGDGLLTAAFQAMTTLSDPAASVDCVRILSISAGYRGMILGQEIDLASEGVVISAETLQKMYANKTGKLLRASALMGAVIGGATKTQMKALDCYASNLGLAFQIADDLLDCYGDERIIGKPVGSDEKSHKNTFLAIYGEKNAKDMIRRLTDRAQHELYGEFGDAASFLIELVEALCSRNS